MMFFTTKQTQDLLKINDGFATLTSIANNGDLVFEFVYSVDYKKAAEHNAFSVVVTVHTQNIKKQQIISAGSFGQYDTKSVVKNIVMNAQNIQNANDIKKTYVVTETRSDFTSFINNEIIGSLNSSTQASDIRQLKKNKLKSLTSSEIKERNLNQPVLHRIAYKGFEDLQQSVSASFALNVSDAAFQMINNNLDPSYIVDMTHKSVTAQQSKEGLLTKTKSRQQDYDASTQLLNYYLFGANALNVETTTSQIPDANTQQITVLEVEQFINIPVNVSIFSPKEDATNNLTQYFVTFELVDSTNNSVVLSLSKVLDVQKHINSFLLPKKPPTIKQITNGDYTTLEIKQIDKNSDGVVLYKKLIQRDQYSIDGYERQGSYKINPGSTLKIHVNAPINTTAIYRAISSYEQKLGFEYTSIVINPRHVASFKSVSLSTTCIANGISVQIQNLHSSVSSMQVFVKNITLRESEYTAVIEPMLIDDNLRSSNNINIVDSSVKQNYIYEYVVKLFDKRGLSEFSVPSAIEYTKLASETVDTKINNVVVSHDNSQPDVTFTIETKVTDNNVDTIINLLKKQDLYDLFRQNVSDEKEFVKGLIAHNIQRVNLTTGQREDFGDITVNEFSDNLFRKNSSVSPLEYGNNYRYEIFVLIRTIDALFETLQREKTDTITKKKYIYNPLKFLHPVVSKEGMLVSQQGLKTNYSKSMMQHGLIGLSQIVEVSFEKNNSRITGASATHFDKTTNIINWNVQGDISSIDSFLIIKEVHGIRTIVGKSHTQSETSNFFQHKLTNNDLGELKYAVVPVYLDYTVGVSTYTNSLVVI